MKKVFLDTNVVLDYYLDREGFSDDAEAILAYGYNQGCSLYVSSLTCANMAYIGRKKFPGEAIYAVLASLFEFAEIASVDSNAVKSAVTLQAKDFEDALQYFSAKAIGVDCIVTRNVKYFPFSELQVLALKIRACERAETPRSCKLAEKFSKSSNFISVSTKLFLSAYSKRKFKSW